MRKMLKVLFTAAAITAGSAALALDVQEAVVAQVVVDVGDQQIEDEAAPELAHVARGRMAERADGVDDVGVAAVFCVPRGLQQRRG